MPDRTIRPTDSLGRCPGTVNTTFGWGRIDCPPSTSHANDMAVLPLVLALGAISLSVVGRRRIGAFVPFFTPAVDGADNLVPGALRQQARANRKEVLGLRTQSEVGRPSRRCESRDAPMVAAGIWLIWPDSFGRSDGSNHYQCHNRYRGMGRGCCDRGATLHASRSTP